MAYRTTYQPLITVVTPTYNDVTHIPECTNSLIDQSYQNWEQIIVDDGSTDETKQVLESATDFRIRPIYHEKNMGVMQAYIDGIKEARGDIVVFQDSDDISLPNRLERVATYFREHPGVDVLYHGYYHFMPHASAPFDVRRYIPAEPFDLQRLKREQYIGGMLAMRKDTAKTIVHEPRASGSWDWYMLLQLAFAGKKFGWIDEGLYLYRRSNTSQSSRHEQSGGREKSFAFIRQYARSAGKMEQARQRGVSDHGISQTLLPDGAILVRKRKR